MPLWHRNRVVADQTHRSLEAKPKQSEALWLRFDLDVEGEAVDEVTDDAATDEALEVFNVVDV